MEIKKATKLDDNIRGEISQLFVDAFGKDIFAQILKMKNGRESLIAASAHMFALEHAYLALIDGEPAGIVACVPQNGAFIKIRKREFIKHFGLITGFMIAYQFGRAFKSPLSKIPDAQATSKTATIELVATNEQYRGKGIATSLLNYVHALPEYDSYVLEVFDTNTNAYELYKRLGYKEIHRQKASKLAQKGLGLNYFLYLKYTQNS